MGCYLVVIQEKCHDGRPQVGCYAAPLPHSSLHGYAPGGVVDINVVVGVEVPVKYQTLKSRVELSPAQCSSERWSRDLVEGSCQVNKQHDPSCTMKSRLRNGCGMDGSFLSLQEMPDVLTMTCPSKKSLSGTPER